MTEAPPEKSPTARPWSARRPQNFVLSAVMVVMAVALVIQAVNYIGQGVGGAIPYLMLIGGPALAIFYVWYFVFYKFD